MTQPATTTKPLTIAVGMSGGVDSSVTAWLFKQKGHHVVGVTMSIWDGSIDLPDEGRSGCFGPGEARDLECARAVAARLGIQHITVPLAEAYRRCVLDPFRASYRAGRTPNPCVVCNQLVKFGALLDQTRAIGVAFDSFATGHYARVTFDASRSIYTLHRGVDKTKDQSYFLARLTQAQLRQVLFPLGGMVKSDVVKLAREAGLGDIADRDESQDFIESDSYAPLFDKSDDRPGPLVDTTGRVLGQHRGLVHYTVGQRQGLGVATGERLYVKELRPSDNTVVLGRHDEVFSPACRVESVNWISGTPPSGEITCFVRLRYRHPGVQTQLRPLPDGDWLATFAEPQFAVAPGQAAVFYKDDEVLGGGWIAPV